MVYYFTSHVHDPPVTIYMGKDKFENESLIKYGWEEDVWFHVDNLSSAHVYLRLPPGMSWEAIPEKLLLDCAQLTKANSIEGNKNNNITVIYTPWGNLKKTGAMDVGQVSFTSQKKVKKVYVPARDNAVVNRLNKTRDERFPDLHQEKLERDKDFARAEREAAKARDKAKKDEEERRKQERAVRDYEGVFDDEAMKTNKFDTDQDVNALEEDFM